MEIKIQSKVFINVISIYLFPAVENHNAQI